MENDILNRIDAAQGVRLARYIAGRCTAAEAAEIRAWAAAAPDRAELLESLSKVEDIAQLSEATWDVDTAWNELRTRHQSDRVRSRPAPVSRRRTAGWSMRAAAILVLAVAGAAVWAVTARRSDAPSTVAMREYVTSRAQRGEVRMPDDTRVVLSVESRLRVPEDFGSESRDVYLEGEALFDVAHDARVPFRVHAADVIAEDLGTVFGVRSYADGSPVTIVVAEGLVEVTPTRAVQPGGAYRLDPGQLARVSDDGLVQVERDIDPAEYLAFADGQLVFKNTPLEDAAAQLERWYDLDIRLASPDLGGLPLTASFQHEPISRVLHVIALSLDLRFERDGREVRFHRQQPDSGG